MNEPTRRMYHGSTDAKANWAYHLWPFAVSKCITNIDKMHVDVYTLGISLFSWSMAWQVFSPPYER